MAILRRYILLEIYLICKSTLHKFLTHVASVIIILFRTVHIRKDEGNEYTNKQFKRKSKL